MTNLFQKYGPWAVITGASSGIGEEFCRQLAAQQFNLVLVARRRQQLEALSCELARQHGIQTKILALDISDENSLKQITVATEPLDVGLLVNNAGFALTGHFLDHSLEEELSLLYVNCRAPLILAHTFGRKMVQRAGGGIINVSSASAFLPMPRWTHYAATKVYDLHLSEGLWFELKQKGVDVLALCPGGTHTEFSKIAGTQSGGMEPRIVVETAIKNLGRKSMVIPGLGNRLAVLINRVVPRQWLIHIGATIVAGMTNEA